MFPPKPNNPKRIYLDYAATTPVDPRVLEAMLPYFTEQFGNASSLYAEGRTAKKALDTARASVAVHLHSQPDTVIFTSGGTESTVLAIKGLFEGKDLKDWHMITSVIEHPAVLETCKALEAKGLSVTYLSVNEYGQVDPKVLRDALQENTLLVSIMYANNEMGSVQAIADIGREILKFKKKQDRRFEGSEIDAPYFHTDACQVAGVCSINVEKLHVDLLSMNGSKLYGPKGVGVLYKRRGIPLTALMTGGKQEFSYRSGTEAIPLIVGFATALDLMYKEADKNEQVSRLRAMLWHALEKHIPDIALHGIPLDHPDSSKQRLANNLSIHVEGIEAEMLLVYLDSYGISVGLGSACSSGDEEASHVLRAISVSEDALRESIRITLGRTTTEEDIAYVVEYMPKIVAALRK